MNRVHVNDGINLYLGNQRGVSEKRTRQTISIVFISQSTKIKAERQKKENIENFTGQAWFRHRLYAVLPLHCCSSKQPPMRASQPPTFVIPMRISASAFSKSPLSYTVDFSHVLWLPNAVRRHDPFSATCTAPKKERSREEQNEGLFHASRSG